MTEHMLPPRCDLNSTADGMDEPIPDLSRVQRRRHLFESPNTMCTTAMMSMEYGEVVRH